MGVNSYGGLDVATGLRKSGAHWSPVTSAICLNRAANAENSRRISARGMFFLSNNE